MKWKCYWIVSSLIDEAEKQFGSQWKRSASKETDLKSICSEIDEICREFSAESMEVSVDEITADITISLVFLDFTIDNKTNPFYDVVNKAKKFSFNTAIDNKSVEIQFVFPGILERRW